MINLTLLVLGAGAKQLELELEEQQEFSKLVAAAIKVRKDGENFGLV